MDISDIRHEISKHLPLIDSLLLFNRALIPRKPHIREIILQRLKEMGFSADEAIEFLEGVYSTKSVISGSFMLAVLVTPMDEPLLWKPDDIDVYSYRIEGDNCSFCSGFSYKRSAFGEFLCSKSMTGEECADYPILNIIANRKWEKVGLKINEVVVENTVSSLRDFVFDTFDFDFCKITYDGKTLSIAKPETVRKRHCIYRGDKEALKYFSTKFEDRYYPQYLRKGGEESFEYDFRMSRLHKTYTIRKEKYEARGFLIESAFTFGDRYIKEDLTKERIEKFIRDINEFTKEEVFSSHYLSHTSCEVHINKAALSYFTSEDLERNKRKNLWI